MLLANNILLPLSAPYQAFDVYVAKSGSDSNDGLSPSFPKLTIQAGVTVAEGLGGARTVHIGAGTFDENAYFTPNVGISFVGEGIDVTVITLDSSLNHTFVPYNYATDKYMFQLAGTNSIADLTIEGNSRGIHGGIYASDVDDINIERVKIENFGFNGIWLKNSDNDSIIDVEIYNSSLSLTAFSSASLMFGSCNNMYISSPYLDELSAGVERGYCIKAFGPAPTQPVIDNLQILNVTALTSATSAYGGGGTANIAIEIHNALITDSLISGGYSNETMSLVRPNGQTDPGTDSIRVTAHTFEPVGGYCMEQTMHNIEIDHCYFHGGKFGGIISFETFGPSAVEWNIHDNVFYDIDTPSGVAGMVRSDNIGLDGLYFYNNTIHFTGASGVSAVLTRNGISSSNVYIRNNAMWDEGTAAVFTLQGGGTVTTLLVTHNQLYGLPEGAIAGGTYNNNLTTDPEFNLTGDRPDPYYRPSSVDSPMYESGVDVGLPFTGSAPTRGAYELSVSGDVVSVAAQDDVEVSTGVAFGSLDLPTQVLCTLDSADVVYLDVTWDPGSYDPDTEDTYTLQGTLTTIDGVTNTTPIYATIDVVVAAVPSLGNITFFGIAANPADLGSTTSASAVAVTPPASMQAGDLVYMVGLHFSEIATDNIAISAAGGQSWTDVAPVTVHETGIYPTRSKGFWCKFNGTWATDPSINMPTDTAGGSVVMLVFRPTDGGNTWAIDNAESVINAGSTITHTITGVTPTNSSTVAIAVWINKTIKVWSNLAGTGWVEAGTSQYRNQADNDRTMSFAYKIQATASATGNVSKDTNFNTQAYGLITSFYESE
jgi:hypothetical protein